MTKTIYVGVAGFIGTIAGYLLCIIMAASSDSSRMEEMIKCPFVFSPDKCSKDCIAWEECHER